MGIFSRHQTIEVVPAEEMDEIAIINGKPKLFRSNLRGFVRRSKMADIAPALVFTPLVVAAFALILVGPILPVGDIKNLTLAGFGAFGFVGMFASIAIVFRTKFALAYSAIIVGILGLGLLMMWGLFQLVLLLA